MGDLRRILNHLPSHSISNADRICLFPAFNFFRFFQDIKARIQEAKRAREEKENPNGDHLSVSSLSYNSTLSDHKLKQVDWTADTEWMKQNLLDILSIDLKIAEFNK